LAGATGRFSEAGDFSSARSNTPSHNSAEGGRLLPGVVPASGNPQSVRSLSSVIGLLSSVIGFLLASQIVNNRPKIIHQRAASDLAVSL
jgi:hypothetical protein